MKSIIYSLFFLIGLLSCTKNDYKVSEFYIDFVDSVEFTPVASISVDLDFSFNFNIDSILSVYGLEKNNLNQANLVYINSSIASPLDSSFFFLEENYMLSFHDNVLLDSVALSVISDFGSDVTFSGVNYGENFIDYFRESVVPVKLSFKSSDFGSTVPTSNYVLYFSGRIFYRSQN